MAVSKMNWMLLTESIYDFVDKRNWLNLSLEQRAKLEEVLRSDLAAARILYEKMPLDDQRKLRIEITISEESLKRLTAGLKALNLSSV